MQSGSITALNKSKIITDKEEITLPQPIEETQLFDGIYDTEEANNTHLSKKPRLFDVPETGNKENSAQIISEKIPQLLQDIWKQIALYISDPADLARFAGVCKNFQQAAHAAEINYINCNAVISPFLLVQADTSHTTGTITPMIKLFKSKDTTYEVGLYTIDPVIFLAVGLDMCIVTAQEYLGIDAKLKDGYILCIGMATLNANANCINLQESIDNSMGDINSSNKLENHLRPLSFQVHDGQISNAILVQILEWRYGQPVRHMLIPLITAKEKVNKGKLSFTNFY